MVFALALADDCDTIALGGWKLSIVIVGFFLDGIGRLGRFFGRSDWCALADDGLRLWYHGSIHLLDFLDGHASESYLQELAQLILDVGAVCLWLASGTGMVEAVSVETEENVCATLDVGIALMLGVEPCLYLFGELMIHIYMRK